MNKKAFVYECSNRWGFYGEGDVIYLPTGVKRNNKGVIINQKITCTLNELIEYLAGRKVRILEKRAV